LDQEPVTLTELISKLSEAQSQYPKLGVIVRGDRKTDLQNAAAVYSACLEAGVSDIGLAVREQTQRR
jgi:biopolymer transport protein ExbD